MKVKQPKIAMVILAAGESKRMRTIKQVLPWKKTTLLGHIIDEGLNSNIDEVFVVLGANSESILKKIDPTNITIIKNRNWQEGMGTSIACAMHYFTNKSLHFDAALIALSDQPLIDSKHFNMLISNLFDDNINIVATQIKNRIGVPAVFDSKYFDALSKLNKDYGARKILSSSSDDILSINTEERTADIDTMEAYRFLYDKYGLE